MQKGHCEHGEFELKEGCHQCTADRIGKEGNTPASIAEAVKATNEQSVPGIPSGLAEAAQAAGAEVKVVNMEPEIFTLPEDTEPMVKLQAELKAGDYHGEKPETAVALRPGEDLVAQGYHNEALKALEFAKTRVIATVADNKAASDDLVLIRKLKKDMRGKRSDYLSPLKAEMEAIRATYEYLMEPILEADKITAEKMLAYDAEQKRIRQEQEEINRKRMEAAQAEMKLTGELSESVGLVEVSPEALKSTRTDLGTSTVTDCWKYRVIDIDLIPRTHMIENDTLLNSIAKKHHADRPVPGVEFYNDPIITARGR